ncbi:hypothetical protein NCS52_01350100 [Fusarium sp. LHS14.1]|nr:hypothetical protein NCS52_01350100 [Fusarium sp. LHS14.1]
MASQDPEKKDMTYEKGEIKAKGAFTAEIHIAVRVSLQDVWNDQYAGSQIMAKRPGMYLKYLPCRYHEVSGDMLTGGAYLFTTKEEAEDYSNWTSNEFEVGEPKTKYWKQPHFKSVTHWTWDVIGAYNFKPVDEHAIGRFQRWTYDIKNAESILKQLYPVMKDGAEKREATSFWLLHRPEDKMIGIQMTFAKTKQDDHDSALEDVVSASELPDLGEIFPDRLEAELELDRTSALLAVWLPLAHHAKGVKVESPNFPALPALSQEGLLVEL